MKLLYEFFVHSFYSKFGLFMLKNCCCVILWQFFLSFRIFFVSLIVCQLLCLYEQFVLVSLLFLLTLSCMGDLTDLNQKCNERGSKTKFFDSFIHNGHLQQQSCDKSRIFRYGFIWISWVKGKKPQHWS